MPDPIMYREDAYVLLDSDRPEEQILTAGELVERLKQALQALPTDELPRDLQKLPDLTARAHALLADACELDVGAGKYLQWYVVRLEK
ncbi:MAG: chlororespiratory reduction protein 7 [Cyanobacteria bacterium J06641_5]